MICSRCGGEVIWVGPLTALTGTKCLSCGARDCQVPEEVEDVE
jgi:DNA-directed RNA polymerase subunit RPC12/RpoP